MRHEHVELPRDTDGPNERCVGLGRHLCCLGEEFGRTTRGAGLHQEISRVSRRSYRTRIPIGVAFSPRALQSEQTEKMMIVYRIQPIDCWAGWQKPGDLFKVMPTGCETFDCYNAEEWIPLWKRAQALAKEVGWEGDIRTGPYVTILPVPSDESSDCPVVIAWKQDNNGTTFVASPYPLFWLNSREYYGSLNFARG